MPRARRALGFRAFRDVLLLSLRECLCDWFHGFAWLGLATASWAAQPDSRSACFLFVSLLTSPRDELQVQRIACGRITRTVTQGSQGSYNPTSLQ